MSVDGLALAEETERICRSVMVGALYRVCEAQATWLEAPITEQPLHHDYWTKKNLYEIAVNDYVDARRQLIRWGAVR